MAQGSLAAVAIIAVLASTALLVPPALADNAPAGTGFQWCTLKENLGEEFMQSILTWACSNGADCTPITPGSPCHLPDDLYFHACYAVNDYWQNMKATGASCDFQGAAKIVSVSPSPNFQCIYPTASIDV